MPPKPAANEQKKVPKKVYAHQWAMEEAVIDAQRLYKRHEQQRVKNDRSDKIQRDHMLLDSAIEKERLAKDREVFRAVQRLTVDPEQLAFQEYEKHRRWKEITVASRLPDVHKESAINTFLSTWRDMQEKYEWYHPETAVIVKTDPTGLTTHRMLFKRAEQGIPAAKRRSIIDDELKQCLEAYELAQAMIGERDKVVMAQNQDMLRFHKENLGRVFQQIMDSLDYITVNTLMYYDTIIDVEDGETLMKAKPVDNSVIKYGLWIKVKEMTRSFTSMLFPEIEIRLDPKSAAMPKLPKALGLSRENVAVRVVQLSFDPFFGQSPKGKEFYALSCTLKVDLLNFTDRPRDGGEWLLRSETAESHVLHYDEYPPRAAESRTEDPSFRVSFEVPTTVVIRQPVLLIGKWVEASSEWEPCSHTTFGISLGATTRMAANPRRATFVTGEMAQFAVLQERVFDVPFEQWSLRPLSFDRVLLTLEGKRRRDASDREFRILIEDAVCKLLSPDDAELQSLRQNWTEPVSLFRQLAQAGFNFTLENEDAVFVERLVPKSTALETKAYADIAQFCQYFTIASSKHNKFGEDPDMALFRLSKLSRAPDEEEEMQVPPPGLDAWHSVRYRCENCVLSAFRESEEDSDLSIMEGCETHHNLYTLLLPIKGEEELMEQMTRTNYLLRRCVYQLLTLIRPLSWG